MAVDPSRPAAPRPAGPPASAGGAADKQLPAQIGRYRVLRKLGAGGMGVVYLAEDPALHRTVALKVLVKTANTPPNLIRRFSAEAQTSAKLRHPNIVTVFDSGDADGHLFLALEYIDGPDLEKVIRKQGKVQPERSVELVRQIARALDHAHALGIVHRDIKPSNILLRRDGTATLTDLGLARAIDETAASGITRAGFTVGTVDYMSPEQARSSKAADVRSDLYSLGCTWYHMITGQVPFNDGDLTNKLRAHAHTPAPDPRAIVSEIPAGVSAVLQRLMAKKPDDRYQTPAELLADLDRPGLCRQAVTADDLRSLAEDAADSGPMPAVKGDVIGWSDEEVAGGSTMVESLAKSAPNVYFAAARPVPRPKPVSKQRLAEASGFDKAARIRAAIVFGIFAVLFAIVIWAISNLDRWFGGGGAVAAPNRTPPSSNSTPAGGQPAASEAPDAAAEGMP